MTVRTIVQGNGRVIAANAATGDGAVATATGTDVPHPSHQGERTHHERIPLAASDRCSPDPCQHTDRYRLVTPFSLRL